MPFDYVLVVIVWAMAVVGVTVAVIVVFTTCDGKVPEKVAMVLRFRVCDEDGVMVGVNAEKFGHRAVWIIV